ncbi:transporter substrate-binding domain-containing protein [Lichenibacterium minor]|uniref:Transporter substrate-binding domain-containing protein n=1 Tax=Lichenibacterium minor TaxID=2316528 RepID=A0A4Q2U1N6_9HYPH|nr:transporter substrate-binding domain-containing protein [Lichenibacterium minor]RYC30373.1 transporter substrate-binding domain-containing protein [Lichenibacterium minor]
MKTTAFLGLTCLTVLLAAAPARADTLSDIKARHKLLVGIDLGLPPYGTVDAAMQPTGSDVEAARLLAADLGVELEIVPTTGANRIPFLQTHKIDAVMASFSITEARKKVIDFSVPYGVISIICAAPADVAVKDAKDLEGKTVAVTRGTGADADATRLAKADDKISLVRFDDDATLITALSSGQQDIMISAPAQLRDINKRASRPIEQKFVIRTNGYAVGLRKGDGDLQKAVNAWIEKDLADGKLRTSFKRWHEADLPADMPKE